MATTTLEEADADTVMETEILMKDMITDMITTTTTAIPTRRNQGETLMLTQHSCMPSEI